jgi:hypothetical protein
MPPRTSRRDSSRGNISADLKSPTQPKGFPHGLTDEEKELIMEESRRMARGMGRDFAEAMGR